MDENPYKSPETIEHTNEPPRKQSRIQWLTVFMAAMFFWGVALAGVGTACLYDGDTLLGCVYLTIGVLLGSVFLPLTLYFAKRGR